MKVVLSHRLKFPFQPEIFFTLIVLAMSIVLLSGCNNENRGIKQTSGSENAQTVDISNQKQDHMKGALKIPIQGTSEDLEEANVSLHKDDPTVKTRKYKQPHEFMFNNGKPRSWSQSSARPRTEILDDELPRGTAFDTQTGIHKTLIKKTIEKKGKLYSLFRPAVSSAEFISAIDIKSADEIADIGCGTGGFEIGLLEHNIQFKTIYAVDINKKMLDCLEFMLKTANYVNREKVHIVHSTPTDVKLPRKSIDIALIINVGPLEIANEQSLKCFSTIKTALRPMGKVYLIAEKFKAIPSNMGLLVQTLEAANLRVLRKEILNFQEWSYDMVVAEKK